MRSRIVLVTALAATIFGAGFSVAHAVGHQAARPATAVQPVTLPIEFLAVGNLEAVRNWHFARIESAELIGTAPDVTLRLRDGGGEIVDVIAPRHPLRELAIASGWQRSEGKTQLTRNDYAERMVAVDVDENGRLIAMASLEPIDRNRNKLRRALGG